MRHNKIIALILIFVISITHVSAKNNIEMLADVDTEFTIKYKELPGEISFVTTEAKTIPNIISIPSGSTVLLEVIKAQKELRWHKSGYILCKLKSYTPENLTVPIDVSDKDLYLLVRKYEKINKIEATIIGVELVLAQGAAFFAPGVDIAYYFVKGAIQRKKHPNWFKAGVHNAYDNSICWFWLKGKPIELSEGDMVSIKDIKTSKVNKLEKKIDKRFARYERQANKRIQKKDRITQKRYNKNEKKMVSCKIVEDGIETIVIDRASIANTETSDVDKSNN